MHHEVGGRVVGDPGRFFEITDLWMRLLPAAYEVSYR